MTSRLFRLCSGLLFRRDMGPSSKIRLFVGGIDFRADKQHVESLLIPFGDVIDVFLPLYRKHQGEGQRNRGYAFVEMRRQDGETAIEKLNGSVDPDSNRQLTVREANERQ